MHEKKKRRPNLNCPRPDPDARTEVYVLRPLIAEEETRDQRYCPFAQKAAQKETRRSMAAETVPTFA
jgi:hypothetical protein